MLERRSALAGARPYASNVLQIGESRDFSLVQASGFGKAFEKSLEQVIGKLPAKVGQAAEYGGSTLMRLGPEQVWIIGPASDKLASRFDQKIISTNLSHSRTRIFLEGMPARDVLAKGIPLDFHESAFKVGMFAMTGLHHTPLLLHCTGANRFELYVMRTFAMSIWEWLTDAALEFA